MRTWRQLVFKTILSYALDVYTVKLVFTLVNPCYLSVWNRVRCLKWNNYLQLNPSPFATSPNDFLYLGIGLRGIEQSTTSYTWRQKHCLLNMGQSWPLFRLFSSFSHSNIKYNFNFQNTNWKSVVGVLGIRTQDDRRRWNHGAMTANPAKNLLSAPSITSMLFFCKIWKHV